MLNDIALIEDYKTMTMDQIAKKYSVSISTIYRHLKAKGVTTVKSSVKGVEFTRTHREVIVGSLLGDGSLYISKSNRSAAFRIEHSIKQAEYLQRKYELLMDLCTSAPHTNDRRHSIALNTACHPSLTPLHEKWYPNGKKVVPFDEIEVCLTPRALAIWYMDDGTIRNGGISASICTLSFTFDEVEYLSSILFRKYGIRTSVHTDQGCPRLYIPGRGHFIPGKGWKNTESEFAKFVALIRPHIPACMSYKLGKA